jgi:hypothetical protein
MLLLQTLQPFRLLHAQAAGCFLPAVVRLLGDPQLATGRCDPEAVARFNLDGPQMPDDLLCCRPFACQAPSCRRLESSLQIRPGL